jgi:hypothetical protein
MKWVPVLILSLALRVSPAIAAVPDGSGPEAPDARPLRSYTTVRLSTEPPVIDGRLDDACWATGAWAGEYVQWIPKEGGAPSQPTTLKLLYDDDNVYVAIRAYDSAMSEISLKSGRRDEFSGDIVGITFDSYHDHRTGFEFDLTASGQKLDLVLTNTGWDVNWNAVWFGKTGKEDSAWTAEFRIPLSQLRYSPDSIQTWGMHSWRWIDRLQEESDWEPQSSTGPGALYLFGELRGIRNLPAPRRIEVMPYAVTRLKTFRTEPGDPFRSRGVDWFGGMGADAKIGLATNFTADLTINPDFGQVESDPSVMNLTAFETFYEERRPFFLEGRNIFSVDYEDGSLFYSRRIGHSPSSPPPQGEGVYASVPSSTTILSAAKVSGKTSGGLSVGVLQSFTANEHATMDSAGFRREVAVEPLTSYTYARLQQDFDAGSTVIGGALGMVNRFLDDPGLDFLSRNAFTGGMDLLHQWNDKEFFLDAKLLGSAVNGSSGAIALLQQSSARYYQREDARHLSYDAGRTSLEGWGGSVKIGKGSKGLWRYSAGLRWRSPGLEVNDFGFMQQVDVIAQSLSVSYFVNQPEGGFRTWSVKVTQENDWNFGLEHLWSSLNAGVQLEFLNQWGLGLQGAYITPALDTRILRGGPAMRVPDAWLGTLTAHTDQGANVIGELSVSLTRSGHGSGGSWSLQPGVTVNPHQAVRLSMGLQAAGSRNDIQYVERLRVEIGNPYILGRVDQHTLAATFRVDYTITPELTIQYYGSPFASVGRYAEFKQVSNPLAGAYEDRFIRLSPGAAAGLGVGNPDFSFSQFRSNLVIRWEFRPGSNLYAVWSQERTGFDMPGEPAVETAMRGLGKRAPENVFLVKGSYWFSL